MIFLTHQRDIIKKEAEQINIAVLYSFLFIILSRPKIG